MARIKELTHGIGADAILECVGTQKSMLQAIRSTQPGGGVGYLGVPHGVQLDGMQLFFSHVRLHGGPAPVRRFLPELIDLIWNQDAAATLTSALAVEMQTPPVPPPAARVPRSWRRRLSPGGRLSHLVRDGHAPAWSIASEEQAEGRSHAARSER